MKLAKSKESLHAAELCLAQSLPNSAANRCYYTMFQSAVVALEDAGFLRESWSHPALQATFTNELIRRKKVFTPQLSTYLNQAAYWRNIADYTAQDISVKRAEQLLHWAKNFVAKIEKEITHENQK